MKPATPFGLLAMDVRVEYGRPPKEVRPFLRQRDLGAFLRQPLRIQEHGRPFALLYGRQCGCDRG
jgi:hypothetical protein